MKMNKRKNFGITAYIILLMLPIYWLLNMSFKTNQEILGQLTLFPHDFTRRFLPIRVGTPVTSTR